MSVVQKDQNAAFLMRTNVSVSAVNYGALFNAEWKRKLSYKTI